ncbi:MAG: hypothetical protein E6R03_02805 [Hyphomicrobiaceae bacterium]|nr:MAG: hypothetical protein E6R03_02805 [Hyphomicrobiaceae bacterium]
MIKSVLGFASKHPIATYYAGGAEAWLGILGLTYFAPDWSARLNEQLLLVLDALKETLVDIIAAGWPGT